MVVSTGISPFALAAAGQGFVEAMRDPCTVVSTTTTDAPLDDALY